jgi:hypothetical protein
MKYKQQHIVQMFCHFIWYNIYFNFKECVSVKRKDKTKMQITKDVYFILTFFFTTFTFKRFLYLIEKISTWYNNNNNNNY